jgi:hypothetical protein
MTPTSTPTPTATATPTPTPTPTIIEGLDGLELAVKDYVKAGDIAPQLENSLLAKVRGARFSVQHGQYHAAANKLEALVHQVRALRGKKVTRAAAANLIHRANVLIERLSDDDGDEGRDDSIRGPR